MKKITAITYAFVFLGILFFATGCPLAKEEDSFVYESGNTQEFFFLEEDENSRIHVKRYHRNNAVTEIFSGERIGALIQMKDTLLWNDPETIYFFDPITETRKDFSAPEGFEFIGFL